MFDGWENFKNHIEEVTSRSRITIDRSDLTKAAVLVPIVFRAGEPFLIVTKRTMNVATHKGQISFPGGVREPGDKDEIENALRETREEIGISPSSTTVIGLLDDYATTTGFAVTPVVGIVEPDVEFAPDPVEVAEIIEVSIADLQNPKHHELVTVEYEEFGYMYHRYQVGSHIIWGATAGIIHVFLNALDKMESR
jgi:8-oxo-dGTP pyrophosphatase MutT (NUDIX family)